MRLKGGQTYRTQDVSLCGRVVSGTLLVYILPYKEDIPGKKLFLCAVSEGEIIPFLALETEGVCWNFQLAALEEAEIETGHADASLADARKAFAKKAGVYLFDESMFQEEMVEKYNMAMIKEEAYVYASAQERVRSIDNCRKLIRENLIDVDDGKKLRTRELHSNKNLVYQAFSFLGYIEGYDILPLEKLKERFPRGMDVFQIASACGIAARKIRPEPGWQKTNIGTFLGYRKEKHVPVVFFRKAGKYWMYDAETEETKKADALQAGEIESEAVVFYRSFGKEKVTLKDFISFGFRETRAADWAAVFSLAVVGALAALLLPQSYEYLTDVLLPAADYGLILQFALMILICMAGYLCISFVKNLAVYGNINEIQNTVMAAVYDRLVHLPEDMIRNYDSADLAQRAIKTAEIFREALREIISAMISLVFVIVFGIRILTYDLKIGMGIIICVLFFSLVAFFLCRSHVEAEKEKQKEEGLLNSLMFQFLCGIQKIRTDGMEDRALYEYLKKYTRMCRTEMRQGRSTAWLEMFSRLYSGVTLLVLFALYSGQINAGEIGQFVGIFTVAELFGQSVTDIVMSVIQADSVLPIYERCRPILESSVESENESGTVGKLEGRIEMSNVSFAYNDEEGRVLNDVSIKADTGEYIGIVGPSGCGKSTLFQILLGFEKPDKGCVFYDNKNLEQISKPDLRKKLGVVLQDESLFTGSIYENISVSVSGMTQDQAWKLLDEVGLKEEVEQMPMGIHTLVTESGNTVSGGQKQRILLARALAGNPAILFLDEATSALDNAVQGKIIKTLDRKRMTRIVIAHRVNTVKSCHRIFVMDHGRIVEKGTYDELLEKEGIFYELVKRQMVSVQH